MKLLLGLTGLLLIYLAASGKVNDIVGAVLSSSPSTGGGGGATGKK